MDITFSPKFEIGDWVYHILPESPKGLVTDITYRHSTGKYFYEVTFDPMVRPLSYEDFELSTEKSLI